MLFRPAALRRAQSPEQLDLLLAVTDPLSWLALVGIGAVVTVAVLWSLLGQVPVKVVASGLLLPKGGLALVASPRGGVVTAVQTAPGQALAPGDPVAVLRTAAGRSASVAAPVGGRTAQVLVQDGAVVDAGQTLATIEPAGRALTALCYLPLAQAATVRLGLPVQVWPEGAGPTTTGYIQGRVADVAPYPASEAEIAATLGDAGLATRLAAAGDVVRMDVALGTDRAAPRGLQWSTADHGSAAAVGAGTPVRAAVVVAALHPVEWVFPRP